MKGPGVILQAVGAGMLVMLAGTIPRNVLFLANLSFLNRVPWAVPVAAVGLWFFWRYLGRTYVHPVSGKAWLWAMVSGVTGIIALVFALRVLNRLVILPVQQLPDPGGASVLTIISLLLMAAPIAGIVEETAFRGYMQGPIERRYGLPVAILITGTMFAVAHLDFTWILWPYYMAVAALYGLITHMTRSILPSVVLHTAGNLYSNLDLWISGHAEWQAPAQAAGLIWKTGMDWDLWVQVGMMSIFVVGAVIAFIKLRKA